MTYQSNGYVPRVGYKQQFAAAGEEADTFWGGLIAGWHMDEGGLGARADVLAVNGLDDWNNNVASVTGHISNAAAAGFGATRTLAAWPTTPVDHFAMAGDVTMICWFAKNAALTADDALLGSYSGFGIDDEDWQLKADADGDVYFRVADSVSGTQTTGGITLASNDTFYFLSATYDSATKVARLGLNAGSYQTASPLTNGLAADSIMFRCNSATLQWEVDELYVFDRLKDDAWITAQYNEGTGLAYPNEPA